MRTFLLAAFVAAASTQLAPAATATCAENHGGTVHVHSNQCPRRDCVKDCDPVPLCDVIPSFQVVNGVGVECD